MKKLYFLAFALLFIASNASAHTITTGDAYSETTVTNNVNGADVYTKIEVEANGEKKVIETTEQGTHSLSAESNSNGSEATTEVEIETETEVEDEASESAKEEDQESKSQERPVIAKIFEAITNFFKTLF